VIFAVVAAMMIGGAFYINYNNAKSSNLDHITSLSQIQNAPATECTYPIGSYGTGGGGSMYIYNNLLRVDISDLEIGSYSGDMQAVLGPDGTFQMDPASVTKGETKQTTEQVLNNVISDAQWKCYSWWFPSSSLFSIPNALKL
jgi:hypothetical protein